MSADTSERVCPQNPNEQGCWWVREGHPWGEGYACICLIDPARWARRSDPGTLALSEEQQR